jgi:hypothetical protein
VGLIEPARVGLKVDQFTVLELGGFKMSSRSEQYIAKAEKCQQYADAVHGLGEKVLYQQLATQWLLLAEQADEMDEVGRPPQLRTFPHDARARKLDSIEQAVEAVVATEAEKATR